MFSIVNDIKTDDDIKKEMNQPMTTKQTAALFVVWVMFIVLVIIVDISGLRQENGQLKKTNREQRELIDSFLALQVKDYRSYVEELYTLYPEARQQVIVENFELIKKINVDD